MTPATLRRKVEKIIELLEEVDGALVLTGNQSIIGTLTLTGNVAQTGNSVITGNAQVTGTTTLNGGLVTFAADDTGGAGFRNVLVPNA